METRPKKDPRPKQFGEGVDILAELRIDQELIGIVSYVKTTAHEGVYVDIGLNWKGRGGFRQRGLVPPAGIPRYTSVRIGQTVKVRVVGLDHTTYEVRLDLIKPRFVFFKIE
jgi:transcriptional accessory protein Tex/SPT6